jgi:acetyl esterase
MPLHPQAERILRTRAGQGHFRPWEMGAPAARRYVAEQVAAGTGPSPAVAAVTDLSLPGPAADIGTRVYRPAPGPVAGVLVWLHGGGFVFGSVDQADALARALAVASGCLVVSVGYRLAPEHPFPAGLEDCYAAVRWVAGHLGELDAPDAKIAVAGDSAGGNLAAAVTLLARERGEPLIGFQALVYPVTWWHLRQPPAEPAVAAVFPPRAVLVQEQEWLTDCYLAGHDPCDPLVSPLLAESCADLPPALVVTAEYDALCDEGERYARKLAGAGVRTQLHRCQGMPHGFLDSGGVDGLAGIVSDVIGCIGLTVREALATTAPRP